MNPQINITELPISIHIEGFKAVEFMQNAKAEINSVIRDLSGIELELYIKNAIESKNLNPKEIKILENII